MARAQLNIGVDVNANPAKKKLENLKKEGVDTVEELGAKNRESIKGLIGLFAPMALAVGAIVSMLGVVKQAFSNAFSQGEVFDDFAEKANTSAQSVAYLKAQADSAGISTKEFEQAMNDLGSGKTTIQALREEWSKLGDSIDTVGKATENFMDAGRVKNFEKFTKNFTDIVAGWADNTLNFLGIGGRNEALIEEGAYRGLSFEETKKLFERYHSTSLRRLSERELQAIYNKAIAQKHKDERESMIRNREYWASTLVGSGKVDDIALVETFNRETGHNWTAQQIKDLALEVEKRDNSKYALDQAVKQSTERKEAEDAKVKAQEEADKKLKEQQDKILKEQQAIAKIIFEDNEILNSQEKKLARFSEMTGERITWEMLTQLATSTLTKDQMLQRDLKEEKRLLDEKKKAQEEEVKALKESEDARLKLAEELRKEENAYIDSFTKSAWGIRDAWTDGGGLIGNARYGLRNQKATDEQIKLANQQLKQAINQSKHLKEIEDTLKGDK